MFGGPPPRIPASLNERLIDATFFVRQFWLGNGCLGGSFGALNLDLKYLGACVDEVKRSKDAVRSSWLEKQRAKACDEATANWHPISKTLQIEKKRKKSNISPRRKQYLKHARWKTKSIRLEFQNLRVQWLDKPKRLTSCLCVSLCLSRSRRRWSSGAYIYNKRAESTSGDYLFIFVVNAPSNRGALAERPQGRFFCFVSGPISSKSTVLATSSTESLVLEWKNLSLRNLPTKNSVLTHTDLIMFEKIGPDKKMHPGRSESALRYSCSPSWVKNT